MVPDLLEAEDDQVADFADWRFVSVGCRCALHRCEPVFDLLLAEEFKGGDRPVAELFEMSGDARRDLELDLVEGNEFEPRSRERRGCLVKGWEHRPLDLQGSWEVASPGDLAQPVGKLGAHTN